MVESTALEMRHTGNCIVGSTPTLSAITIISRVAGFYGNDDRGTERAQLGSTKPVGFGRAGEAERAKAEELLAHQ